MKIRYDHAKNRHTLKGPLAALPLIFPKGIPKRILDIGCGTGTWLKAAKEMGAKEVVGIDGVEIPREQLLIKSKDFRTFNLTKPISLNKKFDAVFCLEVAEHLNKKHAPILIKTLTRHADTIIFSAACPGQIGQNHINCQWPEYWQALLNQFGFACEDCLRWKIWGVQQIEPWYRQNIFLAVRNPRCAGKEARIPPIVHPEICLNGRKISEIQKGKIRQEQIRQIEKGSKPAVWYLKCLLYSYFQKAKRKISKNLSST